MACCCSGFAMIWIGILVGSAMRSIEAVNGLMFTTIFPITFLANTFAPTEQMTPVLRTIAEWNPISSLVQAMRELWGNTPPGPARRRAAAALPGPVRDRVVGADRRGDGAAGHARLQPAHERLGPVSRRARCR